MNKHICTVIAISTIFCMSCLSGKTDQTAGSQPTSSNETVQGISAATASKPGTTENYEKSGAMPTTNDFIVLAQGNQCSVKEPAIEIIREKSALDLVWTRISPQGTAPDVDFGTNAVIAIFMGTRNTGGYHYELGTSTLSDGVFTIEVIESTPGMKEMVTMALTAPYIVFSVPKTDKEPVITIKTAMRK